MAEALDRNKIELRVGNMKTDYTSVARLISAPDFLVGARPAWSMLVEGEQSKTTWVNTSGGVERWVPGISKNGLRGREGSAIYGCKDDESQTEPAFTKKW